MNDDTVRALTKVLRDAGHQAPSDFLRVLAELFAAFDARNGGVSPMRLTVYVQDLADIELSALSRACAELRRESKFLPTIAEVRERVASWSMDAAGVNFSPEQAWDEVMRKVQTFGTNRVPRADTDHGPAITFDDPVTSVVMTAQWWRSIGQAPTETLMSERRVFIDAYKANATRARRELQCGRALAAPAPPRTLNGNGGSPR
jgi:hypothetical protein